TTLFRSRRRAAGRRLRRGRGCRLPAAALRPHPAARGGARPAPPAGRRAHRRGRLRTAEAAAQRLHAGRGREEHVRRVRRPGGPAAVDQLHVETRPVLRRLDGDAERGGRAGRRGARHGRERRRTRSGSGHRRLTRNTPPASSTSTPPVMPRATPMPPEPPAGALATGFDPAPTPSAAPPASPGEAEAPGRPAPFTALLGGTSSPTGSTFPAALKPQSNSFAVSL